ncbi:MAG: GGDEF domain-containing protein [Lachnospiraceae bacterium]|nr:GGDEF domain-containing protein [Lachnospiraceae bacterium]
MIRELFRDNKKKIIIVCMIILVICLTEVIFETNGIAKRRTAEAEAKAVLSELTLAETQAESEKEQLEQLLHLDKLTYGTRGRIYKSLAEISYMSGVDREYNENVAKAMFYLEKGKLPDETARLTMEYAGRLYANGGYDAAKEMLDDLENKGILEECNNQSLWAKFYLTYADIQEMRRNLRDADIRLGKAQLAIGQIENDPYTDLLQAKHDLLQVRLYVLEQNYVDADLLLSKYTYDDTFGMDPDNLYLICDYRLPFYELQTKVHISKGKLKAAFPYVNEYLEYCDTYNFRVMKLNMLQTVINAGKNGDANLISEYQVMKSLENQKTITEMTSLYGQYLLLNLNDGIHELSDDAMQREALSRAIYFVLFCTVIILLFSMIVYVVVQYLNMDALTMLRNRKIYEHDRLLFEKRHYSYCLVMLDIDDFKKVNDCFGHAAGDFVLKRIAAIVREQLPEQGRAYRYGGEEICMILKNVDLRKGVAITQKLIQSIASEQIKAGARITVSGGVAYSENGDNPFREADRCLYDAKEKGKNRVCSNLAV